MEQLNLVLKGEWYDLIDSGIKNEEYRAIKPYWCKRLKGLARVCVYRMPSDKENERICQMTGQTCLSGLNEMKFRYGTVKFRRGYTNTSMVFEIESVRVDKGNVEWGAPEDNPVFIIKLGKRIN